MAERVDAPVEIRLAGREDAASIAAAFAADGAPIPVEQLERYVAEQDAGSRILLLAARGGAAVGYLTLSWTADYPPFGRASLPEIQDLNVLPAVRRQGIATGLLDHAERLARQRGSSAVGLNVGVYEAYGPAQRLYARRGYVPDGLGVTAGGRPLLGGEMVSVDDTLVLHLVKPLE